MPRPPAGDRHRRIRVVVDALASGRLALALLAALIALLFLYLFIPQSGPGGQEMLRPWVEENGLFGRACLALGLTDIRHSTLFYVILGLLFTNLLLCMIRRFRAVRLLSRFPDHPPGDYREWSRREISGRMATPDEAARALRGRGYRVRLAGDLVYGLRGRFAVAGHWVFHASLLFLLLVGTGIAVAPPSFRGTIGLGEGEPFDLHDAPYLATSIPISPELSDLRFEIEAIDVATRDGVVTDLEARISTARGDDAVLRINRPFRERSYQVMAHGFGYMPGWVIVDGDGRMLKGAWVKLVPFPLERFDTFRIGPKTSEVRVRLYPDHEPTSDGDRSRGYALENPRFRTRIVLLGEKIYEGLLAPGERVPIGDDREFFFLPEIRRYLLVDVIREGEHRFVFAGLGLMIFGLALRYARIRKEVVVRLEGGSTLLYGRSEMLEHLFEEDLDRLAGILAQAPPPAGIWRTVP